PAVLSVTLGLAAAPPVVEIACAPAIVPTARAVFPAILRLAAALPVVGVGWDGIALAVKAVMPAAGVGARRAAEQRDELASLHSITSSTRASRLSGTVRPSAFAGLRLITSSYLVGACTGRSAGFSPLRIRSTYPAARRYWSILSAPYEIRPPLTASERSEETVGKR